ncbi:hypothetical protein ACHAXT_005019 [Thalassiosira profunda]
MPPSAPHRPFRPPAAPSKEGRALLDLLRARERLRRADGGVANNGDGCVANDGGAATGDDRRGANDEEAQQLEDELVSRLNTLAASIRRRGLFATPEKAEQYRARASERSSASSRANEPAAAAGSKKRKRPKHPSGGAGLSASSFGIHLDSHSGGHSGMSGPAGEEMDEGLILTAVCRILGASVGRKKAAESEASHRASYRLVCAAMNVVSSLCHLARDGILGDAFGAAVEGEMVGSVAVPLLDALGDTILRLYYSACSANNGEKISGLAGGFKACAAVVSVVETRLSRADKTVGSLRETAWLVLNHLPDLSGSQEALSGVRTAAAALLSTLPLAGNSEGAPSAKLWSQAVTEGVALLQWAIDEFFPVADGGKGGSDANMNAKQHPEVWKEHEAWLSVAKEAPKKDEPLDLANDPTDRHRSKALQNRVECLVCYLSSLLGMEGYPLHSGLSSSALELPLDSLLDAAEVLLSYPLAAEAKHRATKSRLRASPVKDGLISPNGAIDIAPELRVCGHALFDVAVESCRGGSGALSRARRLVGMAVANLQSSCSVAIVSTVDGRRGGVSKMGMWLRGSIPLRAKSITTFQTTMLSLGAGVMVSAGTAKSVARALVLVGGCLLEQVAPNARRDDDGDEWGTLGERAQLAETAVGALASCLAAFGGLIPNDVRGTLDSIVHTCFSTLHARGSGSIFAYAHVKRAVLQLGTNCACVPWGDGGRSANMEIVRTVAAMLRNDSDSSVATAALSTLCVFDAFSTPRAPPLLIPTRGAVDDGKIGKSGFTASSLLQGMDQAKVEIAASDVAVEGKKKASSSKKARKEEAKACTKKSPESTGTPVDVVDKDAEQENHEARESKSRPSGVSAQGNSANQSNIAAAKDGSETAEKTDEVHNPEQLKDETESVPVVAAAGTAAGEKGDEMAVEPTPDPPGSVDDEPVKGGKDEEMKGESDADDDDGSSSLDDFPDIVDEDPDEEDRM